MQRPGEIKNVLEKIHARVRIGNFVWASGSGHWKVCGSREKFSGKEERVERVGETRQGAWPA